MNVIQDLKWRYATKQFDPTRKVTSEDLTILKEAIHLAPSSLGLQAYKVLHVVNKELREKLKPASWNQSAITDASDLFIFCNMTRLPAGYIDGIIKIMQQERQLNDASAQEYGGFVKGYIDQLSPEELAQWSMDDCYLAAGIALLTCANLKIDACPIGGFNPEAYDQILNLSTQGLHAALVLPVGYRSENDKYQFVAKVRKPESELFEEL